MQMIERWIDINGDEYKQVEDHAYLKRFVLRSLELECIKPDNNGCLFVISSGDPVHVELAGKIVGLRHSGKAAN